MYPPYTVHLHKNPSFLFWSIYTNGKPLPVLKNGAVSDMPAAENPKASARQRVQNAAKGAEIGRSTGPKFRPAAMQGKTCQFPFGRIAAMVFIRGLQKGKRPGGRASRTSPADAMHGIPNAREGPAGGFAVPFGRQKGAAFSHPAGGTRKIPPPALVTAAAAVYSVSPVGIWFHSR